MLITRSKLESGQTAITQCTDERGLCSFVGVAWVRFVIKVTVHQL
jgi:hypothetical protein